MKCLIAQTITVLSKDRNHLLALDVLKNDTQSRAILTEISDSSAGALDNSSGIAFSIDLAKTAPLTKGFTLRDLDQRNLAFSTESLKITIER